MKLLIKYITVTLMIMWSAASQAMTIWVVNSGADPFENSKDILVLSAGIATLDLYYDVEGDTSYGYDFLIEVIGIGSINSVVRGEGDSGIGNSSGSGWHQLGGDFNGETGSSVLGFSFNVDAEAGASLIVSGLYTDYSFSDREIVQSVLATVPQIPIPAAAWLFGSGILGLVGVARRKA